MNKARRQDYKYDVGGDGRGTDDITKTNKHTIQHGIMADQNMFNKKRCNVYITSILLLQRKPIWITHACNSGCSQKNSKVIGTVNHLLEMKQLIMVKK